MKLKLRTRLAVAFVIITVVPLALIYAVVAGLSNYQMKSFRKAYNLTEQVNLFSGNSLQIFNRMTQVEQKEIEKILDSSPEKFSDMEYMQKLNEKLSNKYAYMIVRKDDQIVFDGNSHVTQELLDQLPKYEDVDSSIDGAIYLDGDTQHLVKQMDFLYPDEGKGSVFIVSNVDGLLPEIKAMMAEMLLAVILIIVFTDAILMMWVYSSVVHPLGRLQGKECLDFAFFPPNLTFPILENVIIITTTRQNMATSWYSQPNDFKDHPKIAEHILVSQSFLRIPRRAPPPIIKNAGKNTPQRTSSFLLPSPLTSFSSLYL